MYIVVVKSEKPEKKKYIYIYCNSKIREITVQLPLNRGRKVVRQQESLKERENKRGVEEKMRGKERYPLRGG